VKKHSFSKKVLSMVLAVSILISLLPFENIFAVWTTPNNITINDSTGSAEISYFKNVYNTPQDTNMYYVAGQPEDIAYCIDAEANGPGGTAYAINDSLIDLTFRNGLARIAQYGYPTNSWGNWGISASEAQYATQAAMHWWENAVFGGTEGWVRAGVQNNGCPTNYAGTLGYADWLLSLAGNQTSPSLFVKILPSPSAWSAGSPPTSTFTINGYDCDSWTVTLPAGVTYGGNSTFTGSGSATVTVQLTDPAAFAAGSKTVTAEGYSNRTAGQIHYYVAGGGFQNMVVYQQSVSAAGDPDAQPFGDAAGTLSLYKQTEWTTGVYSSEAGATFQVYNSASVVVATITTDGSGNASVSLPYGAYTIRQVSGPGYTLPASDQAYTVSASSPTATFTNTPFTGQIEVNKTYAGLTGSVVEGGAVFQIFPLNSSYAAAGEYQRDQITTNGSGYAISKSLPYGTYTLVQTGAPIGSQINGSTWTFELGVDGATFINGDVDTVNISNTPTTGKLEISKTTNRGYSVPETGAVFEVYSTAFASYAAAPAACRDTLTTNGTGTAISKDLPYGNYVIHQTGMPVGTIAVADSTVTLGATDGAAIHRDLVNTVYWGQIEVNKTTSYAGNVKLEAGAQFQIYSTAYASYAAAPTQEKATITTNASGYAISNLLPYGTYTMSQTVAPIGAQLNTTVWTFLLGSDGAVYLNNDVDTQNVVNVPTFGKLEIAKTTNRGYSVNEAGATFEIYCTEYASYADAPAEYKTTITTDAAGTAITKDLPYGSYSVHQTVMPAGTIATADITVTIGATNGAVIHRDLVNPVYWGQVEVNKTTSYAENVKLEAGARFQIYSNAYASYAEAPTVERTTITTDASGYAISKLMPYGTYTMSQTVAPLGAQLNASVWTILIGRDGATYINNDVDTQNVINIPTFGKLEIAKTTNRGHSVTEAGATFEIYCTEYASFALAPAEYKDTVTTNAAGTAITKDLPYGSYNVHQTVMPAGTIATADITATIGATNGAIIHRDLVNTVYWGQAEINKTTSFGGNVKLEPGATFEIYNTAFTSYAAAPIQEKDTITTNAAGYAITKSLPYGTYIAHQTGTPIGAQLNTGSWSFILGIDGAVYQSNDIDSVNIADTPNFGNLELSKTTNRGYIIPEEGATFEVYSMDYASFALAPIEHKDTITTSATGLATTKDLPYGVYSVHQSATPEGTIAVADFTVTIAAVHGSVIHSDVENPVYWGQAEIDKTTELAGNVKLEAGAVFQIYNTAYASYSDAPIEEKDTITTDANGHAISKSLPYGTYTASQTVAPVGAQLNVGTWTFILGIDGTTYVSNDVDTENVVNQPTFGQYELSKTTNRGYSVDEAGAAFEIYCTEYSSFVAAPAEYKDIITTDINGDAITKLLPYGDYSVHQSVLPAGTKAVADYTVSLKIAQGTVVHQDLVNDTFWGDISVLKYKSAPSSTSGVLTPEAGATFRIYPSEFSTWEAALLALTPEQEAVLMDEITSDMGGVAKTNHQLPYGEYTVEQIDTIVNLYTFKVDAWKVFIGAVDNQTYTYVRNNEIYEQYLAVIKTDAETGQVIKMTGATFQILAADGLTVLADSNGDDSFVTDANGRIDIKDLPLQVGNYFIKETKAPKGYVLNSDLKAFAVSIADHGSSIVTIDYGVDIRDELFADTAQTCQLIVEKQGDVLTSATLKDAVNPDTGARYSDKVGKALSIYQFGYSLTGKAGAVFEVFVGEKDIGDNAGLLKTFDKDGDGVKETELTAGMSLGTITTAAVLQKDGTTKYIASLAGLPLDAVSGTVQYVVKEVKAPVGDLINPKTMTYDFTFADQTIAQIDLEQSFTDARQKVQINVEKQKEAGTWNKETKSFDWPMVNAEGILFGLFTKIDITAPDDSILISADTLVDVLFTNASGIGMSTQDLPFGDYYVKELNVTEDVVMDATTTYNITTAPLADQTVHVASFAVNNGAAIINRQIAGNMEIYKLAADTQLPMEGVVFEVYDKDANLVDTVTTGGDGHAQTIVLPFGTYTLIETKTITGYALADKQSFSIYLTPHDGEIFSEAQMTIEDQKMAQVEVFKVTADGTQTPMNNVVFGVFDAKTNIQIASITTDKDGHGVVYVLAGNYYLQEVKTWDGYALSTEKIPITAEFAHLYTFRQTNTFTELHVTKTSTSGTPLAGMQFTVTNKVTGQIISFVYDEIRKGYVAISVLETTPDPAVVETTLVTGTDGTALILGLVEGEYIVTEIVAPEGYNLDSKPTDTTIGTRTSGVLGASVTIKNSPVTAKTGEAGNNCNLISAALCCLGLATAVLIILRDRKWKRKNRRT